MQVQLIKNLFKKKKGIQIDLWESGAIKVWGETKIGDKTTIGCYTEIGNATIGDNCKIQAKVFIPPGTVIGNNVFIGPGVIFTNDKAPNVSEEWQKEGVTVKDNVNIGAGCIILPGITIGEGSTIGAGTLVTKDIPANSIVYQKREDTILQTYDGQGGDESSTGSDEGRSTSTG